MPYGSGPNAYRVIKGPGDPANDARAALGQGAGLGWGDEAEAAYRARGFGPAAMMAGRAPSRSYDQELAALRAKYEAYVKRNPGRAALFEGVGSVLPFMLPAGELAAARGARVARVARTGAQEAGIGVAYGAGKGETPVERAGGAIAGGIVNGAFGGASAAGLAYSPEILALIKKYGPQLAVTMAGLTAPAAAASKKPAPRQPTGR